jgi:hypothetical protein
LTLPGNELRPLGCSARSQPLIPLRQTETLQFGVFDLLVFLRVRYKRVSVQRNIKFNLNPFSK